jgi:hypothetical protein
MTLFTSTCTVQCTCTSICIPLGSRVQDGVGVDPHVLSVPQLARILLSTQREKMIREKERRTRGSILLVFVDGLGNGGLEITSGSVSVMTTPEYAFSRSCILTIVSSLHI